MKLKEKLNKIKNNDRFIGKMVGAIILSAGIASTCGGVYAAHNAVENNAINYTEDGKYIAGIVATTLGAGAISYGFASVIANSTESNQEDSKDNDLQK